MSPDDYQQATTDAFGNLSDEERPQLGQQLASQAHQQAFDSPNVSGAIQGDLSTMGSLAGMLHHQAPVTMHLLDPDSEAPERRPR